LVAVYLVGLARGEAVVVERFVKRQKSRKLIERLVEADFVGDGVLAKLVRVPHVRD
jgi:putative endonuclease